MGTANINMLKLSSKISNRTATRSRIISRADASFIGSSANQTILLSCMIFLAAGRFGYAPSANAPTSVNLKLQIRDSGMKTNDPAGFTAVDTLAFGAMGHIVGVGIYLRTVGQNIN